MIKMMSITLLCAGTMALGGCGSASARGHDICKDAASTTDYSVKWQDDLAGARQSGKVTIAEVMDTQGKIYSKLSMLKDEKWSEYCDHLDAVRKEAGF